MSAELGLQIGGLILVDNALLCQFVQHLLYLRVHSFCHCLVGRSAELANSIAHCLAIIAIAQSAGLGLTNSLQ